MSYSAATYSRRGYDPFTRDWIAGGASATREVLRRMDDAVRYARAQGIIYGVDDVASGLARVNLFVGSDIASVMRPIIATVGPQADTNSGFVTGDHKNLGRRGGLTADGTSYIDTGTDPQDLGYHEDRGAMGVWIQSLTMPASLEAMTQSWNAVDSWGVRTFNSDTLTTSMGLTGGVQDAGLAGVQGPSLLWCGRASQTELRQYTNATARGLYATVTDGGVSTTDFYIFRRNNSETPDLPIASGNILGGYFFWKGAWSTGNAAAISTFWNDFMQAMGRVA